jgi:MFS transporter, DHA3 family, macrolide efflux protein
MQTFFLIWLGQVVSLIGSDLTQFAIGVWVYEETGSVTQFALISLFIYLPNILISPIAGALVDRWDRRLAMILSDAGTGLITLLMMLLIVSNRLEIYHVYVAVTIRSLFNAFQWPAYAAATSQLVPKNKLDQANGLVQASRAIAKLTAPTMAGLLIGIIQIKGILVIDFTTFLFALIPLLLVRFPQVVPRDPLLVRKSGIGQLFKESLSGWNYIALRQGLKALLMLFAVIYFTEGILQVVAWPFVLSFASSQALGIILSICGCGMLLGSVAMSVFGSPKPRISGILSLVALQGSLLCLGAFQPSVGLFAIAGFGYFFAYPIIISCNRTIWQQKVPLELQGRVFSLQFMLEKSIAILAYMFAGPLVDYFLEPSFTSDSFLASTVGKIIGVGEGRGIAFLFILVGIFNIVATIMGYRYPRLRRVEKELPDAIAENSANLDRETVKA